MMNNFTHYWYARGYFDGRNGEAMTDQSSDEARAAYRNGYAVGVADYRMLDNPIATD